MDYWRQEISMATSRLKNSQDKIHGIIGPIWAIFAVGSGFRLDMRITEERQY
jgi:hypothetical protein